MPNKEILERAIQKAIDGGWLKVKTKPLLKEVEFNDIYDDWGYAAKNILIHLKGRVPIQFASPESIIFNHDFAKALWGERKASSKRLGDPMIREGWKHHLQQMVIADDPIKYLGENI